MTFSIALGNIVDIEKLKNLEAIAKLQAPIDSAERELNSLIELKRSLDMTTQELVNLRINTDETTQQCTEIDEQIQQLNAQPTVSHNWESPLDYNRAEIKKSRSRRIR